MPPLDAPTGGALSKQHRTELLLDMAAGRFEASALSDQESVKVLQRMLGREDKRADNRERKTLYGKTRGAVAEKLRKARHALAQELPLADERLTAGPFPRRWLEESPPQACRAGASTTCGTLTHPLCWPRVRPPGRDGSVQPFRDRHHGRHLRSNNAGDIEGRDGLRWSPTVGRIVTASLSILLPTLRQYDTAEARSRPICI